MIAPSSSRCAQDDLPAEEVCVRCGRFVCDRCRRWQAEQPLCRECRLRLGDRASPQVRGALLLATLGLVLPLFGAVAIPLAQQELGRIQRCETSDAGESQARLARALGVVEVLLLGFGALLLFLRWS